MSLKQSSWLIKAYMGYSGKPEVPTCFSEKMEWHHENQWFSVEVAQLLERTEGAVLSLRLAVLLSDYTRHSTVKDNTRTGMRGSGFFLDALLTSPSHRLLPAH